MSETGGGKAIEGRRVAAGAMLPGEFTYSVVDVVAHTAGERRTDRRIRTRLHEGTIVGAGAPRLVDCRILNQSRSGLRLQLNKPCMLPNRFRLVDAAVATAFEVKLMWQKGLMVGVQVLSRQSERLAKASR